MSAVRVRPGGDGALLDVRVSPGSKRDAILGVHDGRLKLAVTAPPDKGKANAAVLKLLARELGCRPSELEIRSGTTSRSKTVLCRGMEADEVRSRLPG